MCLAIDKKVKNNHHKVNGRCVAYKILTHCDMSPFFNSQYKVGVKHAEFGQGSRDLDSTNFQFGGLHLMLSLKEAKEFLKLHCYANKIIKVYYKPEDVISYGHSVSSPSPSAFPQGRSVVVHSCLIKSLKPVCPTY